MYTLSGLAAGRPGRTTCLRMRILLVITGLGVGGAERLVTGLADHFASSGHDVVLAYFSGKPELKPTDPRVQLVDLRMVRSPFSVVRSLWRLSRLVREFRPTVINTHLVHANILVRLLRLVTPMPLLVSSAHNTNEGGRLRMMAYRFTDRLADLSTNVSEAAVQAFVDQRALRPSRAIAVHNGIDTQRFSFDPAARARVRGELAIADTAPLLLAVGRLYEPKDYPNLLRALARLRQLGHCPQLLIAGDGPLRRDLEELAESLSVRPQVNFLGVRHDVPWLMSACDVFVLCSAREGFGIVVAEAMACERVVVATDCGGVREVAGDTGYLVPPQDPDALANALAHALSLTSKEKTTIGQHARERVEERYSLGTTAVRYLSLFREGLGHHSPDSTRS